MMCLMKGPLFWAFGKAVSQEAHPFLLLVGVAGGLKEVTLGGVSGSVGPVHQEVGRGRDQVGPRIHT